MPLYEYECKKCHHRFERIRKFSDPKIRTCPNCSGPVEQLISASAMQFKGSGWYVNDYPKKSAAGSTSSQSSEGESSAKEADTKKEDKPKSEKGEKKKPEKK